MLRSGLWRQVVTARQQQALAGGNRLLSSSAAPSSSSVEAAVPLEKLKCASCGQAGHLAKDCPSGSHSKKTLNELFEQGRCLICGELGHIAKACPTIGRNPTEAKPPVPHIKVNSAEKYAHKVCFQCGSSGHVMRDCPVAPFTRKIKRIDKRYSGSRLQKMLPTLLQSDEESKPAHESFAHLPPKMGVVVSTSSRKTIGVLIPRTVIHPMLKIPMDKSRKFLVHDEEEKAVCGDVVMVQQTRPISKSKHMALKEVVLSLNARKQTIAEKVAEARKVYAGMTEDILKDVEEKQKRYEERMVELKNREKALSEQQRKSVYAEAQQYQTKLDSIVAEGEEMLKKGNETWIKEISQQMQEKDKESEAMQAKAQEAAKVYREKQAKAALEKSYFQKPTLPSGGGKSS